MAKLEAKIELCMYVKLILDSNRLVTKPMQPADREGRLAAAMIGSSKPIDISPRAANYPQSTSPKRTGLMNSSYQVVEIDRPGAILRDRIDAVNRSAFKMPFYSKRGDLGKKGAGGGRAYVGATSERDAADGHLGPQELMVAQSLCGSRPLNRRRVCMTVTSAALLAWAEM